MNIFGLAGHRVALKTTQRCPCSSKTATDSMETTEQGRVPNIPFFFFFFKDAEISIAINLHE